MRYWLLFSTYQHLEELYLGDIQGNIPLGFAGAAFAIHGAIEILRYMLSLGLRVDVKFKGHSPFTAALAHNQYDMDSTELLMREGLTGNASSDQFWVESLLSDCHHFEATKLFDLFLHRNPDFIKNYSLQIIDCVKSRILWKLSRRIISHIQYQLRVVKTRPASWNGNLVGDLTPQLSYAFHNKDGKHLHRIANGHDQETSNWYKSTDGGRSGRRCLMYRNTDLVEALLHEMQMPAELRSIQYALESFLWTSPEKKHIEKRSDILDILLVCTPSFGSNTESAPTYTFPWLDCGTLIYVCRRSSEQQMQLLKRAINDGLRPIDASQLISSGLKHVRGQVHQRMIDKYREAYEARAVELLIEDALDLLYTLNPVLVKQRTVLFEKLQNDQMPGFGISGMPIEIPEATLTNSWRLYRSLVLTLRNESLMRETPSSVRRPIPYVQLLWFKEKKGLGFEEKKGSRFNLTLYLEWQNLLKLWEQSSSIDAVLLFKRGRFSVRPQNRIARRKSISCFDRVKGYTQDDVEFQGKCSGIPLDVAERGFIIGVLRISGYKMEGLGVGELISLEGIPGGLFAYMTRLCSAAPYI